MADDLGDGLRARIGELERRIAAATALCERFETEPWSAGTSASRGYRLSTTVRDALRGDL